MKASEITVETIANYLRLDDISEIESSEIAYMLESALSYVKSYTGLTMEEIDEHSDIVQAVMLLVSDNFDNRNYYLDHKTFVNENKAVENILSMHCINYL